MSSLPVQKPNVGRIYRALQQANVDLAGVCKELDLDEKMLADENASIDFDRYLALLDAVVKKSDRRFLCMELALSKPDENLGLLTYILRNAATFAEALELLQRYIILVSPISYSSLLKQDGQCILTYKLNSVSSQAARHDVEGTIAQFIILVRLIVNDESWFPSTCYFEHDSPSEEELKQLPLPGQTLFNHYCNGISFEEKFLTLPLDNSDAKLLALLEQQAQLQTQQLQNNDSFLHQVGLAISSKLGEEAVSADSVASDLGMSRRTLNRRLSELATTFNHQREQIIYQLAKQNLVNSDTSMTELAQNLGYSDSSAFNRAFKRLSGQSPREYRNSHRLQK